MTTGRINQVTTVTQRQRASSAASQRTQSARRPAAAGTAPSGRTVGARMCTRTAQHRSLQILAQKTIEQKTGQQLGSHAQPSSAVDGLAARRQWASTFFYDSLPQAAGSRCNLQKEERESRKSPSAQRPQTQRTHDKRATATGQAMQQGPRGHEAPQRNSRLATVCLRVGGRAYALRRALYPPPS